MSDAPQISPAAEPAPQLPQRARLSVAAWLAGVSLLALLPMLGFSAYTIYRATAEQQAQAMATQQRRTSDAALHVGQQLESVFAKMGVETRTAAAGLALSRVGQLKAR